MVISAGSIAVNATLGITSFTANADKVIEKAFQVQGAIAGIAQKAAAAGRTFTILAVGGVLAAKRISSAFITAASDLENYETVILSMTKSTEETARFIKDLTQYAAATPFELNEIISSASVLTATFKGNTDEIRRWLPALADLGAMAKLRKIDFETMTLQFNRMITQGAGAVDLFRDAGILSMLGIDAKIDTDIVKMREKMFKALTDVEGPFKGLAEKLARTFSGIMSQIADQWFMLRTEIMNDSGLFDDLKSGAQKLLGALAQNRRGITEYISSHREMVETVLIGTAAFLGLASALTALGFIIPPLVVSLSLLASPLNLISALLTTIMVKMGVTATVAGPMGIALTALGVVTIGLVYSIRALNNNMDELAKSFPHIASAVGVVSDAFTGLTTVAKNSSLALLSAQSTALGFRKSWAMGAHDLRDAMGLNWGDDDKNFQGYMAKLDSDINATNEKIIKGAFETSSKVNETWKKSSEEIDKNSPSFSGILGKSVWEQIKKDAGGVVDFFKEKFPEVQKMISSVQGADIKQVDYNALLGNPDFEKPGLKVGAGMKKGVDKAIKELERLQEQGRTVFENLFPAEGVIADVTEKIRALHSIGKDSPEAMSRMQSSIAESFKGTNKELLEAEQRLVAMGGAAALVGDGLLAIKDSAAIDEISLQAQQALETFTLWPTAIRDFNENLTEVTKTAATLGTSIATEDIVRSVEELSSALGVDTIAEIERLEDALGDLGPDVAKLFSDMKKKIQDVKVEKFNDQFLELTQAVSGLGPKFKTMATIAETAFKVIRAAQAAASLGFSEILALVIEIINAMGILGGSSEKSMSDMDKFMDDLASTAEDVADRMTDAIVEFARTGKAEIGDLADYILSEFLRAGISNLVVNPAVDFIGDSFFAKGGAFWKGNLIPAAKGHVTSGPELFKFRSGEMGVRGEAGNEAILPLSRKNGVLGVQSTAGPAPIVNIYNNGLPEGSIDVQHRQSDGQNIVDIILNVVNVGLMDGSLNLGLKGIR